MLLVCIVLVLSASLVISFPSQRLPTMSTGIKRKLDSLPKYEIPEKLTNFISATMASFKCCTHDEAHCYRVAISSRLIAESEAGADPRLAYIAGLLHDVLDSKLQDAEGSLSAEDQLRRILKNEPDFLTEAEIEKTFLIIKNVGYKNIIKEGYDAFTLPVEYRCVQDADLLDAIGAIGIARCMAYSGKKNRKLFGLSRSPQAEGISHDEYMKAQNSATDSAVDHFFDKLLTIAPRLTTQLGKSLAQKRQAYMAAYLKQLDDELADCGDVTSEGLAEAVDYMLAGPAAANNL